MLATFFTLIMLRICLITCKLIILMYSLIRGGNVLFQKDYL